MAGQTLSNPSGRGNLLVLECLHSVLRQIADAASDSEVAGILLGTVDEDGVRILSFRRLVPKRAFGRSGALSQTDLDAVARLMSGPPVEGELYGLEPVGWFRAQPRRQLAASAWELELLNALFTREGHVGMFFRNAGSSPARARFYLRGPQGFLPDSYRELAVPATPSTPILAVEAHVIRPEAPPAADPGIEHFLAEMARQPPPEEIPRQPRGWIWRTASSLAIAALVVGYWWWSSLRPQPPLTAPPQQPNVLAEADRQQIPNSLAGALDVPVQPADDPLARDPDPASNVRTPAPPPPEEPPRTVVPKKQIAPDPKQEQNTPVQPQPLRPLRLPQAASVEPGKTPDLSAPPLLARTAPSRVILPFPQSLTVLPPAVKPAPVARPPAAPSHGTLIWTGRLRKNATLVIDGKSASFGTLSGELPGKPVHLSVFPGDLGDNAILVFTGRPQDAQIGWDPPGPQNGWNRIMYEFDPHNAAGIEVAEAPSPGNAWKRLVLRSNSSKLSVVYVKWSLTR